MAKEVPAFITREDPSTTDQNYAALRVEAIKSIQSLASSTWTDHNSHDPGITTLEALCFALTEQGYATNLPVTEHLQAAGGMEHHFFGREAVLPNAPVTLLDWRKYLIDFDFIRNAWVTPITRGCEPFLFLQNNQYTFNEGTLVPLQGLYDVLLEWAPDKVLGELNGNIVSIPVTMTLPTGVPKTYWGDIIFPFTWDTTEPAFTPFREVLSIQQITLSTANSAHPQLDPENELSSVYFSDLDILCKDGSLLKVSIILRIGGDTIMSDEKKSVEDAFILLLSNPAGPVSLYNKKMARAYQLSQQTRKQLEKKRNLTEDFVKMQAINIQEIGILAELELTPGTDAEAVLAGLFYNLDSFISPDFSFQPYSTTVLSTDDGSRDNWEGPLLLTGYLSDEQAQRAPGRSLFLSDLLKLILEDTRQQRNGEIIAVYNLSVQGYINNKPAGKSEENCIRLVNDVSFRPRLSVFKSRITIRERGVSKVYKLDKVFSLFQSLKNKPDSPQPRWQVNTGVENTGESSSERSYYPIQFDFPALYQLSILKKTPVNTQMRGYLFFFEQLLANQFELLKHAPELLSVTNTQTETRFPANIRQILPFYDRILKKSIYDDFLKKSYEKTLSTPLNQNNSRRSILLDHLVGRLGEDFRYIGVWNQLDGEVLNEAKYAFLQQLPDLTANRLVGFNYSEAGWNTHNTSFAEKKLVHLLQLSGSNSLRRTRWKDPLPHFSIVPNGARFGFRVTDSANDPLLKSPTDDFMRQFEAEDAATAVIQWGSTTDNYQILQEEGGGFRFGIYSPTQQVLAVSEATFPTVAGTGLAIGNAANYLSSAWTPTEGMHLLELILLRPKIYKDDSLNDTLLTIPLLPDGTIAPGFGRDAYSQQILVVLPAVGKRFGDPGFQVVAADLIRKELPAWVKARIVWLNLFMMHRFETAYRIWIDAISNPMLPETALHTAKSSLIAVVNDVHDELANRY